MSKKPVADIVAMLEDPKALGSKTKYVSLGPLWLTEKGSLSGTIEAEPIAWKDPAVPRAVVISLRPGVELSLKDKRRESYKVPPEGKEE